MTDRLKKRLVIGAWLGFVLAAIIFTVMPTAELDKSRAFGCYTTAKAAPILLDETGMHILQDEPDRVDFHLEEIRSRIVMTAEATLSLRPDGDRYTYHISTPPLEPKRSYFAPEGATGTFLDFVEPDGSRTSDLGNLRRFTKVTTDSSTLIYTKVAKEHCLPKP
ncbi:hypothetical protein P1X14_07025 [Sphingomonas sp. AOB5]|uniref:hypothetical protein n=1 Tax=Sphingomonas sp. AOB5 TaxID=3034017 RepID=UPI0023F8B01D|nr:hypothetical protein [Sphingomonas sp. AOB5]MDF7774991.1 hypothetical protein [Sphingomonas sp. AOB5]